MPFLTTEVMAAIKQKESIARETEANLRTRLAACQRVCDTVIVERDALRAKVEAVKAVLDKMKARKYLKFDDRNAVRLSCITAIEAALGPSSGPTLLDRYQGIEGQLAMSTLSLERAEAKLTAVENMLAGWERAWPCDVFPAITQEDTKPIGGLADRISAAMGRHMAGLLRREIEGPTE